MISNPSLRKVFCKQGQPIGVEFLQGSKGQCRIGNSACRQRQSGHFDPRARCLRIVLLGLLEQSHRCVRFGLLRLLTPIMAQAAGIGLRVFCTQLLGHRSGLLPVTQAFVNGQSNLAPIALVRRRLQAQQGLLSTIQNPRTAVIHGQSVLRPIAFGLA